MPRRERHRMLSASTFAGALAWLGSVTTLGAAGAAGATVQVRVSTVKAFLNPLAGQRVRVLDGVVKEVASPRVFLLSAAAVLGREELGVFVEPGIASATRGGSVVVTGVLHESMNVAVRLHPSMTSAERKLLARVPVVLATSAITPGGIELVMRPGR